MNGYFLVCEECDSQRDPDFEELWLTEEGNRVCFECFTAQERFETEDLVEYLESEDLCHMLDWEGDL